MKPREWYEGKGFPVLRHEDITHIVGHHSGASASQSPNAIEAFHMRPKTKPDNWPKGVPFKPGRGWRHVAYHKIIAQIAGKPGKWAVFDGVPLGYQGIHCKGFNQRSLSVLIVGPYDDRLPPAGALRLAVTLYIDLRLLIGNVPLIGHGRAAILAGTKPRDCPGASNWPGEVARLLPIPPPPLTGETRGLL